MPSHVYEFIANKDNGFVTFFISKKVLNDMIDDVFKIGGEPPVNKIRKVIFKEHTNLSTKQKLSIVGKLVGRNKISENEIYDAMLLLNDGNIKITFTKLAALLNCSDRTVYRNMSNELKKEKELLNQQL